MSALKATSQARRRRPKRRGAHARTAEFRLPKREEAKLKRQIQYLDDRTRYLVVSSFGPRFVLYYDVGEDLFAWNEPTGGTVFKRRSMAAAVARLLGTGIAIVKCKVDKKGKLVKSSVHVHQVKPPARVVSRASSRALGRRS